MKPVAYRMSNTGAGSDRYGACEVCGKHCSTVYLMTKVRRHRKTDEARRILRSCGYKDAKYSYPFVGSWFGHKSCLATMT